MSERVLDAYTETANGVSQRCLYIAYGIVATGYALQSTEKTTPFVTEMMTDYRAVVFFSVFAAICSILCDYLQYFCRFKNTGPAVEAQLNQFKKDRWYSLTEYFFWLKQVALLVSVVLFLYAGLSSW